MVEAEDDALVVRFGSRDKWTQQLLRDAQEALDDLGRPDVSVFCAPAEDGETDVMAAQRICLTVTPQYYNGKWFRHSRVGWIGKDGFLPRQDDPANEPHPYHYNVDIGEVSQETAERFFRRFETETRNNSWRA